MSSAVSKLCSMQLLYTVHLYALYTCTRPLLRCTLQECKMATKDPSGQVNRQTGPGIQHKGLSAWTSTGILGDFVHSGRPFELFLNN